MLDRFIKFWTSLRLTVVCLALGIVLIFVGTVAQADEGLYVAQERYFKQWMVWGISFFGYQVPLALPGGYLLGTVLLVNLVAAHIKRFQLSWKKLGIHITHTGLILMLLGQLATDLLSRETHLSFAEGETRGYTESPMSYELAFITPRDSGSNHVAVIPETMLAGATEVAHPELPCAVRVKQFWPNSDLNFRAPMMKSGPPLTDRGLAQSFDFQQRPVTRAMNDKNVPTALVELATPGGTLGTWVVSGWAGDDNMVDYRHRLWTMNMGRDLADQLVDKLTTPQTVEINGRPITVTLRPTRHYEPFSMTLLKTTHEVYPGTDKPRNFQSRVRIENPLTRENREVDIYMNNPLRYEGLTFFQHQMGRDEVANNRGTSTLQVVRNPSWLTPYIACLLVGGGLLLQFFMHLFQFIKKRRPV